MATLSNTSFFSPTQISGCALWLDAADQSSIVLSGGNVSVWRDKSGNTGRDAVPSTGSGGTYPSNRINGLATVGMTISGNMRAPVPAQTFPTELSAFVVFMKTGTNTKDTVIHRSPNGNTDVTCSPFLSYTGTRVIGNGTAAAFTVGATNPFSNVVPTLYNFNISSNANTTWNEWINGSGFTYNLAGGTPGYGDTSTQVWLGAGTNVANPTMAGVIAEVIMYNRNPSTAQRTQIEGYLAWKWGLQSNLPSSHPFYNYNPNVPNINLFTPTTVIRSPLQVSGCALWLDAGDAATIQFSSGINLSNWIDKSGNGRNAIQATSIFQPSYTSNAVIFGLSTFLTTAVTASANTETVFMVTLLSNTTFTSAILGQATGNGGGRQFEVAYTANATSCTARLIRMNQIYVNVAAVPQSPTSISLAEYTNNGTTSIIYWNGASINTSVTPSAFSGSFTTAIGTRGGALLDQFFNGRLYEILIYSNVLSTDQRQQVEGYLAWKWGLQSSLPTTHPFYNFNPSAPLLIQLATLPIVQSNTTLITMNPTQISGCALWLDAADSNSFGLTGGSNITSWNDKSGNARNFSLVGSTNPVLTPNIQNGQSVVTFNGTNQVLSNTNFVFPNSAYTVFSLHLLTSTVGNSSGFQRVIQTDIRFFMGVNSVNVAVFTGTAAGSWNDIGALTPNFNNSNRWALLSTYSAPSGSSNVLSNFINGTQYNTKNGTTSAFTGLTIGGLFNSQWWNGYVSEIIIYNSVLSTAQRQQVEGYLSWKWGTQSNLPTSHPYYYNPLIPNLVLQSQLLSMTPSFSPLRFSGASLWLDAADPASVITSGNLVTQWNDKSGNGKNATTSTNFPQYSQSSLNRLATLRFNGSSGTPNFLDIPAFDFGTSTRTIFFLARNTGPVSGTASTPFLFWPNTGNATNSLSFQPWISANIQGTRVEISYSAPLNTYLLICFRFGTTAGFEELFNNGTLVGSATKSAGGTSYANATSGYRLGWLTVDNNPVYYFDGNIGEVIIYNTALTTNQTQQVEGYLAWKWGLQSSLPANHPYKLFPPS